MSTTTTERPIEFRNAAIQDMLAVRRDGCCAPVWRSSPSRCLRFWASRAIVKYPERVEAPFVLQTETVPLAVNAGAVNYGGGNAGPGSLSRPAR